MSEDLWDLSMEELEKRYNASKVDQGSPDTQLEEELDDASAQDEDDAEEEFDGLDEETEDDDLEQPDDQDSDHDASTDESKEEDTEEDGEADPDEDAETGSEVDADKGKEVQPTQQLYKFKANGREYEFSEEEVKAQFPKVFGQAMDYTKKMQTIKPWRKTIDAIEQAKLSHEDLSLAIDVLKGDKDAIAEVLKRTGTDALDLNVDESKYVAKDYGRDDTTLAIKDVLEDISKDVEYETTHKVLSKEWDEASWGVLSQKPDMIKALHIDVKEGTYDKVQPIAEKLKVFDGGKQSDLDYYGQAARIYYDNLRRQESEAKQLAQQLQRQSVDKEQAAKVKEVKAKSQAREATKQASEKRKAAAPTKSGLGKPNINELLDADDDETYMNWRKSLDL